MNGGVNPQRIYICEKGVEKIITKAVSLTFIKTETVNEVLLRLVKDLDIHLTEDRIFSLASDQSENRASP